MTGYQATLLVLIGFFFVLLTAFHRSTRKFFSAKVRVNLKPSALLICTLRLSSIALVTSVFLALSGAIYVRVNVLSSPESQVFENEDFEHRIRCSLPQNTNFSDVSADIKYFLRSLSLPQQWKYESNVYYWNMHGNTFASEISGAARCKGTRGRRLLLTFGDTIDGRGDKRREKLAKNMTAVA